jgi:hypothetical protein
MPRAASFCYILGASLGLWAAILAVLGEVTGLWPAGHMAIVLMAAVALPVVGLGMALEMAAPVGREQETK